MSRTWHSARRQRARTKGARICRAVFDVPSLCPSGKRCYDSESLARSMLKMIQAERAYSEKVERHAYECTRCGQWHLTSMDQQRRAR